MGARARTWAAEGVVAVVGDAPPLSGSDRERDRGLVFFLLFSVVDSVVTVKYRSFGCVIVC